MVRPTTGAPQMAATGRSATYMGTKYDLKYTYEAETTYVPVSYTHLTLPTILRV